MSTSNFQWQRFDQPSTGGASCLGMFSCMCSPTVVSMAAIFDAFSNLQSVSQFQEVIDIELLMLGQDAQ
jgi:hypothetical protein